MGKLVEKHAQDGELSGMLLVYPLSYIHVLEVRAVAVLLPDERQAFEQGMRTCTSPHQ